MSEFQYYLKRYPKLGVTEAGPAYLEDDGRIIIYAKDLRTLENKVYEYKNPQDTATDGWMLD